MLSKKICLIFLSFHQFHEKSPVYFFELLNEVRCQNKRDYEFFNLSNPRYVDRLNIRSLFLILDPKSRFPALKAICETTKAFGNASGVNYRGLIEEISETPGSYILFQLLLDNAAASDCEYLLKSELLCLLIEKLETKLCDGPLKDDKDSVLKTEVISYLESCLHDDDFSWRRIRNYSILDHVKAVFSFTKSSSADYVKQLTSKIDNQRLITFLEDTLSNMKKLTTHSQGRQ